MPSLLLRLGLGASVPQPMLCSIGPHCMDKTNCKVEGSGSTHSSEDPRALGPEQWTTCADACSARVLKGITAFASSVSEVKDIQGR